MSTLDQWDYARYNRHIILDGPIKKSGVYEYLQLVRNERIDGRVRQQVLATLGRLDVLRETGQIDALIASCGRARRSGVIPVTWKKPRVTAKKK